MTLQELHQKLTWAAMTDPANAIQAAYALRPELKGTLYYEAPLLGCAAADDPLFRRYREDPRIYGAALRLPEEWLPGAKSVLSIFMPYTKAVRDSNRTGLDAPSHQWLHARIEGQEFLTALCAQICRWLEEAGYRAMVPADHRDFVVERDPARLERQEPVFASRWSERHAAFAAGLGTFGLAKNFITEKGCCGRLASIITDAPFAPTPRPYSEPYEYCTFCGACAKRCPVDAISVETGKDILACSDYIDQTMAVYAPRYGCGKCQLSVPCETRIPGKAKAP